MTRPVTVPNVFQNSTSNIPLSLLDNDLSTLATAINDPASYANYGADTGAANAYVVSLPVAPSTLASLIGLVVTFKPLNSNTSSSTLNLNALGAINIVNYDSSSVSAGQIQAGGIVAVSYNGTNFIIVGSSGSGAVAGGSIYENKNVIATSYTITTGKNAMSVGPMTINSGVVVTVPSGSRYIVL